MSEQPAFLASGVPEHLPGEPPVTAPRGLAFGLRVVLAIPAVLLLTAALLPLWVPYLLLAAFYGRPPNVPRWSQVFRYLRLAWTARPPPPGIPLGHRLWLSVLIVKKAAAIPYWGLAWLLDEVLFGRRLDALTVAAPLFEVSASRSGSTQVARYLEEDPALSAPNFLQCTFPYLWAWRIAPSTIGRVLTPDRVRHIFERLLPAEFRERHEGEPYQTDTFEVSVYLAHLNHLSLFFGPDVGVAEFGEGVLNEHNRAFWEEDFVRYLDRIGRKHLLWLATVHGRRPRLFVKGHFLAAAPELARRFPDARFLTVIRDPAKRLQSAGNYLRSNPFDGTLGPIPWGWLGPTLARTEIAYCDAELAFYTAPEGPRRCVVRFDEYVRDLPGTMARIYAECLDAPVPPHVPREHPPRRRTAYALDRSLPQFGVDPVAFEARLAEYRAWCKGAAERRGSAAGA